MAWFRKKVSQNDLGSYLGILLANQVCVIPDLWRHVYAELYRQGTPLPDMTNGVSSNMPVEAGGLYSFVVWKFFAQHGDVVSSMFDTLWSILAKPPKGLTFEDRPIILPERSTEEVKVFGAHCLARVEEYSSLAPKAVDVGAPDPTGPLAGAILRNAFGLEDPVQHVLLSGQVVNGVAIVWHVLEKLQGQVKLR